MSRPPRDASLKRRGVLGLLSTLPLTGFAGDVWARSGQPIVKQDTDPMTDAYARQQERVNQLYSNKPIRVVLGHREYRVPANHFGATWKNEPDSIDAGKTGFAFVLFLPDFNGFTKENWRDPFDRNRIDVLWVKQVDKNAMVRRGDGIPERISPAGYGDPKSRFNNGRSLLEVQPSLRLYGLEGYRRRGKGNRSVTWVGHRSNGEFFYFDASYGPGDAVPAGTNPLCTVQYYSAEEDLSIAYRYSQDHIDKWRQIDDAIWTSIHSWQVK